MANKKPGKASTWLFLLLALLVYAIDANYRLLGGVPIHVPFLIPYLLLVGLAYALLLDKEERTNNGGYYLKWFSICSLVSYLAPMANGWLQYSLTGILGFTVVSFVWFFILISPFWMLYLGFGFNGKRAEYTSFIGVLYIIIWAGFGLIWFSPQIMNMSLQLDYAVVSPVIAMDYVKDQFVDNLSTAWNYLKEQYNLLWMYASGEIEYAINPYKSRTDDLNKRKIGVYVDALNPVPTSIFSEGMPVSVEGRVRGEVIENEVMLKIDCMANNKIPGEIYPLKNEWQVVRFFDERIDCSFEGLPEGSHQIEMSVSIENFKTLSYLRAFFINEDALFQLRRQGKDPLRVYNLYSSDFVTIHTPGPMKVGMELGTPPIGINPKEKIQLKLGVGLSNTWLGELKKIKEVFLIIPEEFRVIGITGLRGEERVVEQSSCSELPEEDAKLCDNQLESVYKITQNALESLPANLKNIPVVFSVRLEGDGERILQNQPFTNKYFKTTVVYDYKLSQKASVAVRK